MGRLGRGPSKAMIALADAWADPVAVETQIRAHVLLAQWLAERFSVRQAPDASAGAAFDSPGCVPMPDGDGHLLISSGSVGHSMAGGGEEWLARRRSRMFGPRERPRISHPQGATTSPVHGRSSPVTSRRLRVRRRTRHHPRRAPTPTTRRGEAPPQDHRALHTTRIRRRALDAGKSPDDVAAHGRRKPGSRSFRERNVPRRSDSRDANTTSGLATRDDPTVP